MARVNLKAETIGKVSHLRQTLELIIALCKLTFRMQITVRTCVQLNDSRADTVCRFNLSTVRRNENGNPAASFTQRRDEMRKAIFFARHFQTTFRCALFALFWHNANGMRFMAQSDRLHFIRCCHFKIQRHGQMLNKGINVCVCDVAAVFTQMSGNDICTSVFRQFRSARRIGSAMV